MCVGGCVGGLALGREQSRFSLKALARSLARSGWTNQNAPSPCWAVCCHVCQSVPARRWFLSVKTNQCPWADCAHPQGHATEVRWSRVLHLYSVPCPCTRLGRPTLHLRSNRNFSLFPRTTSGDRPTYPAKRREEQRALAGGTCVRIVWTV